MAGTHYKWVLDSEDHVFSGQPSRRAFDRFNGDQVLFLINFYGSLTDNFTIEEGRRLENEIYNQLPMDAKSEVSVINWIRDHCFTESKS